MSTVPSDEELLEAASQREPEAFEQLYQRYQRRALSVAYSLLGPRTEAFDAVQIAFLGLYRNLKKVKITGENGVRRYLFRSVKNACLDILRKPDYQSLEEQSLGRNVSDTEPFSRAWQSEQRAVLLECLEQLSPRARLVMLLRHVEEFNEVEVVRLLTDLGWNESEAQAVYEQGKYSHQEILEHLEDCSVPGAVGNILSRARKRVKRCYLGALNE